MSDIVLLLSPSGYEGSIMGLNGSAISFGKTVSTFFVLLHIVSYKIAIFAVEIKAQTSL